MTTHELKSWPGQFEAMWTGRKRAEFRRDDRGYQVGDLLELCEWDPSRRRYTGFRLTERVTHLLRGPELEVPAGFVVLSLEVLGARVVDSGSPPEYSAIKARAAAKPIPGCRRRTYMSVAAVISSWLGSSWPSASRRASSQSGRSAGRMASE